MDTFELKIPANKEAKTGVVFGMIKAAVEAIEISHPGQVKGLKIYVPFWFDLLMDFDSIQNPVIYTEYKSDRFIFGHIVIPGYEESIVVANTSIFPYPVVKISRP